MCFNTIRIHSSGISSIRRNTYKNLELEMATLIISNEEMDDIMKIIKSLEESGLLMKDKTIENKAKEQKGGFLSMALGTLDANLLGHLLTGKEMKTKIPG